MIGRAVLLFAAPALLIAQSHKPTLPILPNDKLTPGVVATTDEAKVCVAGYSKTVRHTSARLKAQVYREYGITKHKAGDFEIDHLQSLEIGGADTLRNLWPESYKTQPWNAHVKDRLEDELRRRVCVEHSMTLVQAQQILKNNWIAGYKKYVGVPPK